MPENYWYGVERLKARKLTDRGLAAGSTVLSGDLEETVCVDLEGGDELGLAAGHRGNTSKLEFTEQTVVTALGTFTLVAVRQIK